VALATSWEARTAIGSLQSLADRSLVLSKLTLGRSRNILARPYQNGQSRDRQIAKLVCQDAARGLRARAASSRNRVHSSRPLVVSAEPKALVEPSQSPEMGPSSAFAWRCQQPPRVSDRIATGCRQARTPQIPVLRRRLQIQWVATAAWIGVRCGQGKRRNVRQWRQTLERFGRRPGGIRAGVASTAKRMWHVHWISVT